MAQIIINHFAIVNGPGLRSPHPFGGGLDFAVLDPERDIAINSDETLTIFVAPRTTDGGVLVEKTVRFPRGAWTSVTTSTTTREA